MRLSDISEKRSACKELLQVFCLTYGGLEITKSAPDDNLEKLRLINKQSYFVYKLHQDNERVSLVMAASGLQLAGQNSQDDSAYVNPISTLIQNKCWAPTDATQGICDNPSNPSMTQH